MAVLVKVRPEKLKEFLQAVGYLKNDIERQEGLKKVTIYQEIDDQTACSLVHDWETQEYLDRYLGSEEFGVLLGALEVLGEKSEIRYGHVSGKIPNIACVANEKMVKGH